MENPRSMVNFTVLCWVQTREEAPWLGARVAKTSEQSRSRLSSRNKTETRDGERYAFRHFDSRPEQSNIRRGKTNSASLKVFLL